MGHWEDFWWNITESIKNKGLKKEFDDQLKKMDNIIEKIENIIEDIERDDTLTITDILETLYKLKEEAEDQQLAENNMTIEWDDLAD